MLLLLLVAAFLLGIGVSFFGSPHIIEKLFGPAFKIRSLFGILDRESVDEDNENCPRVLITKKEIEGRFERGTWQREVFEEFKTTLLAREAGAKTFPCVYATKGFRDNEHRYVFLDTEDPSEPHAVRILGPAIRGYLKEAREIGGNTSLVVMCAPSSTNDSIDDYTSRFWSFLRGLRILDSREWPSSVPTETADARWTFCFEGEQLFPIALTPGHEKRWSRHSSTLLIAMQPKWVIDNLLSTQEKRKSATERVRGLLKKYDNIDISPDLAAYGDLGTSESKQLFLLDDNQTSDCPYKKF